MNNKPPNCTCDIDMNMFIPGCPVHDPQNTGVPPAYLSGQPSEWSEDYSGPTGEDEELEREAEQAYISDETLYDGMPISVCFQKGYLAARKYRPEQGGEGKAQPEDGYYIDRNGTKFKMTVLSDRIVYENINVPVASYFVYHPRVQKPVKAVNNKVDYNYPQPLPQEHDKETRQQLEFRLRYAIKMVQEYEEEIESLEQRVNFYMKETDQLEKYVEENEKRIAELEAPPDERNGIYVHDLQSRIKELEAELSKILEWMEQNEDTLTIEYEWHTIRKIREVLKR